jgi:hypothetical protein
VTIKLSKGTTLQVMTLTQLIFIQLIMSASKWKKLEPSIKYQEPMISWMICYHMRVDYFR